MVIIAVITIKMNLGALDSAPYIVVLTVTLFLADGAAIPGSDASFATEPNIGLG